MALRMICKPPSQKCPELPRIRKRKRATQLSDSHRGEGEDYSKRNNTVVDQVEVDELVRNLAPVRFVLSSELTLAHITIAHRDFPAGAISNGKHNKDAVTTFSLTQAVDIANYFFTSMLGNDLQQRIVYGDGHDKSQQEKVA